MTFAGTCFVSMHPYALYAGVAPDRRSAWQTSASTQNMIRFLSRRMRQRGLGFWELNAFLQFVVRVIGCNTKIKGVQMGTADTTLSNRHMLFMATWSVAYKKVQDDTLPEWFREYFCDGDVSEIDRIIKDYAFPPEARDWLLALPLALNLSLSDPPASPRKKDDRNLGSLTHHLGKSVELITKLEECNVKGFGPELVEEAVPKHSTETLEQRNPGAFGSRTVDEFSAPPWKSFTVVDGPSEILRHAIEDFLKDCAARERPKARAGQKTTYVMWAEQELESLVKEHAPGLSMKQRTELSAELIDPVRKHHGHKSRVDTDPPRADDRARRAAQPRMRKTRSRKIGQKKD